MAATWTAVVLVCQAGKLRYGVPALRITNFDDGTALVRFAAGNFRIVPVELLKSTLRATFLLSRFAKSLRSCRSQQENGDGTR
jgi:hypothetical protein